MWAVGKSGQERFQTFDQKEALHDQEAAVFGAIFNKDESRVLTWSADGSARLWGIPNEPITPLTERIIELELLTASQLYGSRELRVLSFDEWEAKKREREAMRANRQAGR
jgi:hypothetical protein